MAASAPLRGRWVRVPSWSAVVLVDHRQDAAADGDGDTRQLIGVAGTVVTLVVVAHDLRRGMQLIDGHEDVLADHGMLHDFGARLAGQQVEGLGQQVVGQPDLADVVQQGRQQDVLAIAFGQAHALGDGAGVLGDAPAMPGQAAATQFEQARKDAHRGHEAPVEGLVCVFQGCQRFTQLRRPLGNLLLQAGVECLQFFVLLAGEGNEARVFDFQSLAFERVANRQDDFVVIPGLGDVAVDFAAVDGCDGGCDVRIAGKENAHDIRPAAANLFEELGAIHFRHAHVGNDQVDGFLARISSPSAPPPAVRIL